MIIVPSCSFCYPVTPLRTALFLYLRCVVSPELIRERKNTEEQAEIQNLWFGRNELGDARESLILKACFSDSH